MGCKSSKMPEHNIRVVHSAGPTKGRKRIAPSSETNLKQSKFASNPDLFSAKKTKSKSSLDSDEDSLFGNNDSRHSSAGSKSSKQSDDSGFEPSGDVQENVITEESDPSLVQQVEDEFAECDLDLFVEGTSVRQIKQDRELERKEERHILQTLQQEGLLVRPESRAQGGVSFEITEVETDRRPPPRLEKLELRRKKRTRELTADEIQAKLERAEERRKRKEQERIAKINTMHRKEQDDVLSALETYQEHQKRTEEGLLRRVGSASENRERRLKEMRDRLREKRDREELVRQRKKEAREMGISVDYEAENEIVENSIARTGRFNPMYDDEDER